MDDEHVTWVGIRPALPRFEAESLFECLARETLERPRYQRSGTHTVVIRTDATVIRDTRSVIEQLTDCNLLRSVNARKPSGQAVIQAQTSLFTKLQDKGSEDTFTSARYFRLRSYPSVSVLGTSPTVRPTPSSTQSSRMQRALVGILRHQSFPMPLSRRWRFGHPASQVGSRSTGLLVVVIQQRLLVERAAQSLSAGGLMQCLRSSRSAVWLTGPTGRITSARSTKMAARLHTFSSACTVAGILATQSAIDYDRVA